MPIYEYECEKCGSVFEMMQSMSAKPLRTHTGSDCKGKVRRLVSASGFILKGDGWYANDYPSESRKKGWEQEKRESNPDVDSKHTCGSGCNHGSSPESKPAAESKPEAKPKPASKPKAKSPYSSKKKSKASKS
jgi:putative FmdB family regulatory protein